ncbi:hypothetical protein GGI12_004519, partial [Dipsacomyces acuminosporus]
MKPADAKLAGGLHEQPCWLEGVRFSYPIRSNTKILKGISFEVVQLVLDKAAKERTALTAAH